MESVPAELLERVLVHLAPSALVVARAVCRRWRAAVAALAERDRAFASRCGYADIVAIEQRFSSNDMTAHAEDADVLVACTCGAVVPAPLWSMVLGTRRGQGRHGTAASEHDSDEEQCAGSYRDRHSVPWPPARWEILVRERALAMHMASLGLRLATDLQCWDYCPQAEMYLCTYLPSWVHLPNGLVRPTTVTALVELVHLVFSEREHGTVERLAASPADTRKFYAGVDLQHQERNRRPTERLRSERALERREAFFAAYPNGPAIITANKALALDADLLGHGCATASHTSWDRRTALDAMVAMTSAFEREEVRTGHGPADPLIADAEWHDTWMLDEVVMQDAHKRAWDEDDFHGVVRHMGRAGLDRPPPFNADTFDRVRYSDPSGWSSLQWNARTIAAAVRRCLLKGRRTLVVEHLNKAYFTPCRGVDWGTKTDAELLEVAERMVSTTDAVKAAYAACCTLPPVAVQLRNSRYTWWLGGLSPTGHLVGTSTLEYSK